MNVERQIELTRPKLHAYLQNLCLDSELAQDLTQETLLRALKASHQLQPGRDPLPWALRIAFRLFLDHRRTQGRRLQTVSSDSYRDPFGRTVDLPDTHDVERTVLGNIITGPLFEFLGSCTYQQRMLVLSVADGLDEQEISELLGIPVGTVKSRMNRVRVRARKQLRPQLLAS